MGVRLPPSVQINNGDELMTKYEYDNDLWINRKVIVHYPDDPDYNNLPAVAMKRYNVLHDCIWVRSEGHPDRAFHYEYIHLVNEGPLPLPG